LLAFSQFWGFVSQLLRLVNVRKGHSESADTEAASFDSNDDGDMDEKIFEYISSKGGAIALNKASKELAIPIEVIKDAIGRMSMDGKLKPYADMG
jgi:hypothetical protein